MRRVVILERAEVEHLRPVGEVHRELVALAAFALQHRLAAQPRVVAAERDRRAAQDGVAAENRALQTEVPRARAVLLHREIAQVRVVADEELGDRVDEVVGLGRTEAIEHGRLGVLAERDDRVRERRPAVAFAPVQHEDRILDHDTGGNLHERAAREERVVQHGERVFRRARRRAQEIAHVVAVAGREAAHAHALGLEPGIDLVMDHAPVAHDEHRRAVRPRRPTGHHRAPARRRPGRAPLPRTAGSGRGRAHRSGCSARSPLRASATRSSRAAPRPRPGARRASRARPAPAPRRRRMRQSFGWAVGLNPQHLPC